MPSSNADVEQEARRQAYRGPFEAEVTRLMDRLYGTALRLTRDPDEAEDVVAETVSTAWAKLDELRDIGRLEGWLFQILSRTFVDLWRRRQRRKDKEAELPDCDAEPERFSLFEKLHQPFLLWWGTPEEQFLNDQLQEDIQRALDALPDAFRVVVVFVEVQGYKYEEVARLLDIPLGTVRSRLNRGRALLQKALWQQAREAGLAGCIRRDRGQAEGGER